MKTLACLAMLGLVGCGNGAEDDSFPVLPGGGGAGAAGGGSGTTDQLRGRVCVAIDLRDLSACKTIGADGLTVALGSSTATTAADGSFAIATPQGSNLVFRVTGAGVIPTSTPFSPSLIVPAIDAVTFARELTSNAVTIADRSGSILGTVVRGDLAASGVRVITVPAAPFGPFFDAGAAFGTGSTGPRGVFFVPGLAFGAASMTFRDVVSGRETTIDGVQVVSGGVTILDSVALP